MCQGAENLVRLAVGLDFNEISARISDHQFSLLCGLAHIRESWRLNNQRTSTKTS